MSAHLLHPPHLISEMSLESGHSFNFHYCNPGFFSDSSLSSTIPAELLSYKNKSDRVTLLFKHSSWLFFFPIESSSDSLAWLSLSEISLTLTLIVIYHPSFSQTLWSEPLSCSFLPQQKCQTLCGSYVFTYAIPLCLANSFSDSGLLAEAFFASLNAYLLICSLIVSMVLHPYFC